VPGFLSVALAVLLAQQVPQEQVTFHSETQLVMLSFHVARDGNHVTNLKSSDVILLEDGKPRQFTIFDSPETLGRMPLELVLLFDTNPKIDYFWDPKDVFHFISEWDDEMSKAILDSGVADIRISVYHCSGQMLYRMTAGTKDPHQFGNALRRVLTRESSMPDSVPIRLSLPADRRRVGMGPFTNEFVTSYFYSAESRGWPMEAGIGVLNDLASSEKVSRLFVMFSEGIGATTTIAEDLGNHALDLGIPVYPIATNYQDHISGAWPRNLFRMHEFASLGQMTGGRTVEHPSIDARTLVRILQAVKSDGISQYVVGFVPESAAGKLKEHKLEIRLASKNRGMRRATY
jgi:VWFA-related protein